MAVNFSNLGRSESSRGLLFPLTPAPRQLPLVFSLQGFESAVQPEIHEDIDLVAEIIANFPSGGCPRRLYEGFSALAQTFSDSTRFVGKISDN